MNIQIFGTKKSQDTKKAERYFKERGIKFQAVDLKEKGISKGELQSVLSAVGDLEEMLDEKTRQICESLRVSYGIKATHREKWEAGHGRVLSGYLEDLGIEILSCHISRIQIY